MNNTMAMSRLCEENPDLLRKEERLWRGDKAGKVDCAAQGDTTVFLTQIHEWKTPSHRLLQTYPWQDPLSGSMAFFLCHSFPRLPLVRTQPGSGYINLSTLSVGVRRTPQTFSPTAPLSA